MATGTVRGSFTGVWHIVRFNWHFYAVALLALAVVPWVAAWLPAGWRPWLLVVAGLAALQMLVSLLVSWWVYDVSALYRFTWVEGWALQPRRMVNIHAGFDETSASLAALFPQAHLQVFDFYDAALHTEVSIRRARRLYAPYPGTQPVATGQLPLAAAATDVVWLLLSAHEIRQPDERIVFFRQLKQALAPGGCVVLVEHLRDLPNFVAFNLGCFHFHSRSNWQQCWQAAGLQLVHEQRITPFVRCFKLH